MKNLLFVLLALFVSVNAADCGPSCTCEWADFPPMAGWVCANHPGLTCCSAGQRACSNDTSIPICSDPAGMKLCPGNTGGCVNGEAVAKKVELVATPCGTRPKQCVVTVPSGSIVSEHPAGLFVSHPMLDGSIMEEVLEVDPICHQPRWQGRSKRTTQNGPISAGKIPDGWLLNAYYFPNHALGPSYSGLSSTFTVPGNPVKDEGQTLFYFLGLQDEGERLNILQPVLAYGGIKAPRDWNMASWICCPANITVQSEIVSGNIKPGSKIAMDITREGASTWTVSIGTEGKNSSLTQKVGSYEYDYADVTLEVYDIKTCSSFGKGPATFDDITLLDKDGKKVSIDKKDYFWTEEVNKQCGGKLTLSADGTKASMSNNP